MYGQLYPHGKSCRFSFDMGQNEPDSFCGRVCLARAGDQPPSPVTIQTELSRLLNVRCGLAITNLILSIFSCIVIT